MEEHQPGFWTVVINRQTLAVEYNKMLTDHTTAPDLGSLDSADHLLLFAGINVGLNVYPQGDLFNFLDANGAGGQLRRVDQFGAQLNCGSWGSFSYALAGTLGETNTPGFEVCSVSRGAAILTVQLLPTTIGGKTSYSIIRPSDA